MTVHMSDAGASLMSGWYCGIELMPRSARYSLEVAQEPIHGRRKTEKDRRPIAHAPILRFRMRLCHARPDGTGWDEEEVDVRSVEDWVAVWDRSSY